MLSNTATASRPWQRIGISLNNLSLWLREQSSSSRGIIHGGDCRTASDRTNSSFRVYCVYNGQRTDSKEVFAKAATAMGINFLKSPTRGFLCSFSVERNRERLNGGLLLMSVCSHFCSAENSMQNQPLCISLLESQEHQLRQKTAYKEAQCLV